MNAGHEVDIPAYAALLWRGEQGTRPGPKRSLDLHALAQAGMRLADAAGLDAVSMRKVSADMGVSSMALYRYVKSKQELLLLMIDEAFGPPPAGPAGAGPVDAGPVDAGPVDAGPVDAGPVDAGPVDAGPVDAGPGWREGLAAWAHACRRRLRAHPWVLGVPVAEPAILPYQVQWTEWGLDALAATPLTEPQKLSSLLLVNVYVRGQTQLALGFETGAGAAAQSGVEAGLLFGRRLLALTDPVRYPRVTAAMNVNPAADYETDFGTDEFNFGLNTVLDGIQVLIARR